MKKKLLSIALAAAMVFAISSIALAYDPDPNENSTATIEFDNTEINAREFWHNVVGNFEFDTIAATADEVREYSDTGVTLEMLAIPTPTTIQVEITDFYIGDEVTLAAFNLALTGVSTNDLTRGFGTTTGLGGNLEAGTPLHVATVNSNPDTLYDPIYYFSATLTAGAGTAMRVGVATAQMIWTVAPDVTP